MQTADKRGGGEGNDLGCYWSEPAAGEARKRGRPNGTGPAATQYKPKANQKNEGSSTVAAAGTTSAGNSGSVPFSYPRPIAALDMNTGELLRVYRSVQIVSQIHQCTQTAILTCCAGYKANFLGFRWQYYEGPALDCESLS